MTNYEMVPRVVQYGELIPCRTAFIDTHTPGSNSKENFTIIGGGVSENPDQHVHIRETPGFNIGAAGQPPKCRNSLHSHSTAEVFFVLKGRWRFFWGRWGDAGSVVLDEGDIFDIPTGIFRGFENIGDDYGMLMAVIGGDDAGGGVIWAPQVIEEASRHGLILSEDGTLYDSQRGEKLPDGVNPMPPMSGDELADFGEPGIAEVVPRFVARRRDMEARAQAAPAQVIGEAALIIDRPGFEIDFLARGSIPENPYSTERNEVLMVSRGHWRFSWEGGGTVLGPGDTCLVPPKIERTLTPSMSGEVGLFRVRNTDDPAGPTWRPENCSNPVAAI